MKSILNILGLIILSSLCRDAKPASIFGLNYNPEDFVVAQPTCVHRLPLTRVNRLWRGKGIRSFTVVNNTELVHDLNNDPSSKAHLESFGYWEDDSLGKGSWRGGNVGDTRAAVTPLLAHRHFGDTYKWMLYGDDDTLFYMTGVLKLLENFDPEQPLAITDNIWFYAQHTNPGAPRCLPCGFNMSTIITNHTFTPRPACPFCTRALACGTYGPPYRCNASHLSYMETEFGPHLLESGTPGGGAARAASAASDADANAERHRGAMRGTAGRFAAWMDHHVDLKSKYPEDYRDKPAMDWEMREPSDWHTRDAADKVDDTSGDGVGGGGGDGGLGEQTQTQQQDKQQRQQRRRRSAGRRRRALQQHGKELYLDLDPDVEIALDLDSGWQHTDSDREMLLRQRQPPQHGRRGDTEAPNDDDPGAPGLLHPSGRWRLGEQQRGTRRLHAGRKRPVAQGYVDGSPWLSSALGRPLGGPEDPARQALKLPYPFCARHDERFHKTPAPSCLLSVSGHGGTGIIFSVGLLRMIETEEALRFIMSQRGCGGGDCLLGRLIWFRMGIGFTDPGTALQYGAPKYEKFCRFVDSNEQLAQIAALSDPAAMLLNRRRAIRRSQPCDRSCVWLIENVVGLHVRAQNREVNATAYEMIKRIRSHRRAYDWILEARRDPEVAAGTMTVVRWVKARYENVSTNATEGLEEMAARAGLFERVPS